MHLAQHWPTGFQVAVKGIDVENLHHKLPYEQKEVLLTKQSQHETVISHFYSFVRRHEQINILLLYTTYTDYTYSILMYIKQAKSKWPSTEEGYRPTPVEKETQKVKTYKRCLSFFKDWRTNRCRWPENHLSAWHATNWMREGNDRLHLNFTLCYN